MDNNYIGLFQNETKQALEEAYQKMTEVEKSIADFLIKS